MKNKKKNILGNEINKLTKIALSGLMMLTCINFSTISAEDLEGEQQSSEEIVETTPEATEEPVAEPTIEEVSEPEATPVVEETVITEEPAPVATPESTPEAIVVPVEEPTATEAPVESAEPTTEEAEATPATEEVTLAPEATVAPTEETVVEEENHDAEVMTLEDDEEVAEKDYSEDITFDLTYSEDYTTATLTITLTTDDEVYLDFSNNDELVENLDANNYALNEELTAEDAKSYVFDVKENGVYNFNAEVLDKEETVLSTEDITVEVTDLVKAETEPEETSEDDEITIAKTESDTVKVNGTIILTGTESNKHKWVISDSYDKAEFLWKDKNEAKIQVGQNEGTVVVYHYYDYDYFWREYQSLDTFTITVVKEETKTVKVYVYVNGSGYSEEALEVLGIDKSTLDANGYFPVGEINLDASYLSGKSNIKTAGAALINSSDDWETLKSLLSDMNTQTLIGEYAENKGNHIPEYLTQAVGDVDFGWGTQHTALFYWPDDGRTSYGFEDQTVRYHLDLRFNTSVINYVNGNNGIHRGNAKDGRTIDTRTYISGSTAIEPRNLSVPDGYKLVGYYSDYEMTQPWIPGETIVEEGATVYVKLAKMGDVVINYVAADGGSVSLVKENFNPVTGTPSGSTATASTGKVFDGWYSDAEYTNKVSDSTSFTPSTPEDGWKENTSFTYYAKFIDNEKTVTVNYYWNNTDTKVAESSTLPNTYKVGDEATASPITVEGYTAVSSDDATIVVSAEESENVINFYYYKNVELTANSATYTYDGETKSVSGYTGAPQDVVFEDIEVSASGTNFGNYDAVFGDVVGTIDTTEKYIVSKTTNGSLVINKRTVTLTSATDSKEYDGTPLTNTTVTVTGDGFAEGEVTNLIATGTITDVKLDDGKIVGVTNTITYTTTDKFNEDNYEITENTGTLTITKRVVKLQSESAEKKYDGVELTRPDVTYLDGTSFVEGEVSNVRAIGHITNVKKVNGQVVGVKNVIQYTTVDGKFKQYNYDIQATEGELKILPNDDEQTVTITGKNTTVTYDGDSHSVEGYDVSAITGITITLNEGLVAKATGTDAYTYYMGLTEKSFTVTSDNYTNIEVTVIDGYLTINRKEYTVTTDSGSKVYDGSALRAPGKVNGLVKGETVIFETTGNQTSVGSSKNTYTLTFDGTAKESNYKHGTDSIGTLEVTQQTINPGTDPENPDPEYGGVTINDPTDSEYDKTEHKFVPEVKTKNGTALTLGTDYTVVYKRNGEVTTDFTNVGTITVEITGIGNYKGTVTKTYQITPAFVTVSAINNGKVYGTTDPKLTASVTGLYGDDTVVYTIERETGEEVGEYEITVNGETTQGNYTVTYNTATFTITKSGELVITPELSGDSAKKVYDGTALTGGATAIPPEGTTISYSTDGKDISDSTKVWTTEKPSITNVGTLNVIAKAENANYETVTVRYTLEVTPKNVTVTAEPKTKVYGEADPELTAKVNGTIGTDTVEYTVTRDESGEEVRDEGYAISPKGETTQGNYKVEYAPNVLTITAKSITPDTPETPEDQRTGITVTEPSNYTYDGKDHQEVLVVKDTKTNKTLVEGTDYVATYNTEDFKDASTIEITVKGIGNYTGEFTKSYEITRREYTVTTYSASKEYDGKALTASGKVNNLVEGETVIFETTGNQTSVGSSKNTYTLTFDGTAKESNYKHGTDSIGTLEVTKKEEKKDDPTPTPTPTPNPGCPAGTVWNEDTKTCQAIVIPVTPAPTPTNTPVVTPTPSAEPTATPEATASAEPEKSAEPTASAETIVDPDGTPEVARKGHWALINLVAAVVSVLLGIVLVLSKNKKDKDEDEEQNENEDTEEVKRHKRWKVVSVIDAVLAVVVFIFTENMRLPMVLVDKWTMLMVLFAVVSVISLVLGRKYHENEDDEENAEQA